MTLTSVAIGLTLPNVSFSRRIVFLVLAIRLLPISHTFRWRLIIRPEIPSNYILTRVKRPSWYLGGLVIAWGLVMTFSGMVQTYEQLLVVRVLLGAAEYDISPLPDPTRFNQLSTGLAFILELST